LPFTTPNILTLIRLALIPLLVLAYYWESPWRPLIATSIFVLAGFTDWLDGYLARRLGESSPFGAFLDPVADKLVVGIALVLLVADPRIARLVLDERLFTIVVIVIIGREITISALREWMAEIGQRANVRVSSTGKLKTVMQMLAIGFLLYAKPILGLPILRIGEILLYLAAILTLWSMIMYLRAAWPALSAPGE
jgi:CDP-diacylglycerol--glycerol-3-phosphate 3-phosphatidyltransferase